MGGQTTAHGVRMLRQVLKIGVIIAFLAFIGYIVYQMYTIDHWYYRSIPNLFKAIFRWDTNAVEKWDEEVVALFNYAGKQIKPALKFAGGVFLGYCLFASFKGRFTKRKKKIETKSPIRIPLFKNPFHKGYYLGKASLPRKSENTHILVTGGTGSGKTNAFHHILKQVQDKKQKAIILDTTGVFVKRYYNQERKDVILNPLDKKRSKHWTPWLDAKNDIDREALAKSFIPKRDRDHDSYWKEAAAIVFSSLLEVYEKPKNNKDKEKPIEALTEMLLARPIGDLLDAVAETSAMAHISKEGDKTTASIRSTAASYLNCLKHLQTPESSREFSITEWLQEENESWLFLSCDIKSRDTMKPLLSAWYSTAIRALMSLEPSHNRRIWFVNDELPSMDQINGLNTCLTEGRKYGACALLATQSPSQLIDIYGHQQAQTITSNCMTKVVFRETEPKNAEQLSKLFGDQELEETHEGLSYGANDMRDGVTQSKQRRKQALVSVTDIQNLKVNYCYLRDTKGKIKHLKLRIAKSNANAQNQKESEVHVSKKNNSSKPNP